MLSCSVSVCRGVVVAAAAGVFRVVVVGFSPVCSTFLCARVWKRKDSGLWLLAVVRCDCDAAGMRVGGIRRGACLCGVCGNGWCVCPPGTSVCRGQWVNRGQGAGLSVVVCRDGSK